jgi:dTDP-4-amino-4,6-dideoxygalactose transaminase
MGYAGNRMLPRPPQPRFRFYGSSARFLAAAAATLGPGRDEAPLRDLERRVAAFTGAAHAVCMPRGRVAFYIALRCLIRPGQKVILSTYLIPDLVNMVICAGGRPVFADVDPESANLDPEAAERLIDGETGAVVATHLHGLACDVERLAAVCRRRGVRLIEDAAHAFGCRVGGRHVGTVGDVGLLSFSRAKNVNGLFGGMVITDDATLRRRMAEAIAAFPFEDRGRLLIRALQCAVGNLATAPLVFPLLTYWLFRHDRLRARRIVDRLTQTNTDAVLRTALPGHYRRRMRPLQARLIARQLDAVDAHARRRLELARVYHAGLAGLPDLVRPPLREDGSHVYLAYPVQVRDPEDFVQSMTRAGRDLRVAHHGSAADLPCFAAYARDCPRARRVARRLVLLPMHPGYAIGEAKRNVDAIRHYFDRVHLVAGPAGVPIS